MYARKLSIYGFKCFGKAILELRYPGPNADQSLDLPNVNFILGDNGGGKSSVLRAVAIAALAPALLDSGFVAYRLVRRPDAKNSFLKLACSLGVLDGLPSGVEEDSIELIARIDRREKGNLDRLHLESTPNSPIEQSIYDDFSHTFFVVGYGATRRMETGDFLESSSRRSRGLRYQRVAGLFEDQVTLRPLHAWLPKVKGSIRKKEAIEKINALLPDEIEFEGKFDELEQQYVFNFKGSEFSL